MESKIEYKMNKAFAIINTIGAVFIMVTVVFLFAVKRDLDKRMVELSSKTVYYDMLKQDNDILSRDNVMMDTYIKSHKDINEDYYYYYNNRTMEISDTN